MKEIALTQGKVAVVDDDNYNEINKFKWYAKKHRRTFYAVRNIRIRAGYGGQRCIWMHREILGVIPPGLQTDHINGNGLDNRIENLRIVTPRENSHNMHIKTKNTYHGVHFIEGRKKPWVVRVWYGNFQKTCGYYRTEEEAVARYREIVLNREFDPRLIQKTG